jgi:hypothetical protein
VLRLDALAAALLAAAPLRVAPATAPEELDAVLALRHAHVVAHGWADPSALPAGAERDVHDDVAISIAAWDGHALAGAIRVVPPVPGRRLPVEEAFDLVVEPAGRVAEIGRLLVAEDRRGDPGHRAWGALFGGAWQAVRARGWSVLGGSATPQLVERYRAVGLPFEVLGPPRHHWGEDRVPVRMDPQRAEDATWYGQPLVASDVTR